ncbi:MAG: YdeI/OmpD-associated family protein [Candidatus Moraniibacteriota bacterium]|nr:MAG: YdeI/OmpD-associated family protein [Candidatus Moranbacteria bacterium]
MKKIEIATGVVHEVPEDMEKGLVSNLDLLSKWNKLTPLARNEWICWVTIVKTTETRKGHIDRLSAEIMEGKKRPCCWPGCPHRRESAKKWFKDYKEGNNMKPPIELFIESKVLPEYQSIVVKFRALIKKEFSDLKEEMRGGTEKYYGVPVYRNKRIVITLSPTKRGITFSFSDGKKFEDKYSLLEGEGNKSLNLRLSKAKDYKDEILRYYIKQAIAFDS